MSVSFEMSSQVFAEVVASARLAPSADNTQPWSFERMGAGMQVYISRERMLPTDVANMFSWIAVGAAVENIVLSVSKREQGTEVDLPRGEGAVAANGDVLAASLSFFSGATPDALVNWIERRVSNRRPYDDEPLAQSELSILARAAGTGVGVHWVREKSERQIFADLMASCDRTRLEYRPFHEELFAILRLSEEEARRRGDGLSLASLEIPESEVPMLQAMSDYATCEAANEKGFSRELARGGATGAVKAGAVGILSVPTATPAAWIEAGRAFQRVWLRATERGFAFQPIGGLPQFLTRLALAPDTFTSEHRQRMEGIMPALHELVPGLRGRALSVMFRVGKCDAPPSGRSYRLPTERLLRSAS